MLKYKHPEYWNVMHITYFLSLLYIVKYCDFLKSVLMESRMVTSSVVGLLYGFYVGWLFIYSTMCPVTKL